MKQCPQCGKQMSKTAVFCGECGAKMPNEKESAVYFRAMEIDYDIIDGYAVTGYVFGMLGILAFGIIAGFIGSIFSLIGLRRTTKRRTDGMGLAVTGLIVGLLDVLLGLVYAFSQLFA